MKLQFLGVASVVTGVAFSLAPLTVAQAQTTGAVESVFQRDRNVSVRERPRPAYDALGIRAGGFLLFPRVEGAIAHEDNIYATETNETSDEIYSVLPSVAAESQWSRHGLSARVAANVFKYADNPTENNSSFSSAVNGRLDVVRGTQITSGLLYDHLVEPRTSASSPTGALDPVEYDQFGADLGASREFNRTKIAGTLRYRSYDFSDVASRTGGLIDEDYRNNAAWEGALRADYALSPALAIYATTIGYSWAFKEPRVGELDRDAKGYQLAVGADFELSNVMRGQLQAGYLNNKFEDVRVEDFTGLGFLGRLEYFPTELLTIEFNAEQAVQSTGVFFAGGVRHTGVGVQADYELLRNLILTARAGYAVDDYRGLDRRDKIWQTTVGANYLVNRRVGVNLLYRRYDQNSSGVARGFNFAVNRIHAGLVVQF